MEKVVSFTDIKLGDTVRISGKDCLVIATYQDFAICIDCAYVLYQGFVLKEEITAFNWSKDPNIKHIPNIEALHGNRCFWCYDSQINMIEGIVKRANENVAHLPAQTNVRNERPCPQCGRKNDIGVKECWHCMRPNP